MTASKKLPALLAIACAATGCVSERLSTSYSNTIDGCEEEFSASTLEIHGYGTTEIELTAAETRILLETIDYARRNTAEMDDAQGTALLEAFGATDVVFAATIGENLAGAEDPFCTVDDVNGYFGGVLSDGNWALEIIANWPLAQQAQAEARWSGDEMSVADEIDAVQQLVGEAGIAPIATPEWSGSVGSAIALLDFANRADTDELLAVPLIGEVRAEAIEACRTQRGAEACDGGSGPYLPNTLPTAYSFLLASADGRFDVQSYYLDPLREGVTRLALIGSLGEEVLGNLEAAGRRKAAGAIESICDGDVLDEEFGSEALDARLVVVDDGLTADVYPGKIVHELSDEVVDPGGPCADPVAWIVHDNFVQRRLCRTVLPRAVELTRREAENILEMLNRGDVVIRSEDYVNESTDIINLNLLDSQDHGALYSDTMYHLRGRRGTICGIKDLAEVEQVAEASIEALRQFSITWEASRRGSSTLEQLAEIADVSHVEWFDVDGDGRQGVEEDEDGDDVQGDDEIFEKKYSLTVHQTQVLREIALTLTIDRLARLLTDVPYGNLRTGEQEQLRSVAERIYAGVRQIDSDDPEVAVAAFAQLLAQQDIQPVISSRELDRLISLAADFRRLRSLPVPELESRSYATSSDLQLRATPIAMQEEGGECVEEPEEPEEEVAETEVEVEPLLCEEGDDMARLVAQRDLFVKQRGERRRRKKRPGN